MWRWMIPAVYLALAGAGCSGGTPPPRANEMAPTPRPAAEEPKLRPTSPQAAVPAPPASGDGIAARVNNDIITWKDVRDVLKDIKPADQSPELRKSKLREMAEERLFLQAAKKNNLSISELELDEAQRRDVKMYGNEEEFEKVIRIRWGTKTAYREDKRKQLLIFKLYRHLLQQSWTNPGKDTPGLMLDFVSPESIREYYNAHKDQFQSIEQIAFIRIGLQYSVTQEEETKQALAESLVRKLAEGAEFTMLAYFYSDVRRAKDFRDRGVSRKDLEGFYTPETIRYLFDEMKEGQISGIVKDGKTLNIFKMEQKFKQKEEGFEEAQIKIRNMMENQKREENRKQLRDYLRKDAYVWPADLFDFE